MKSNFTSKNDIESLLNKYILIVQTWTKIVFETKTSGRQLFLANAKLQD